jgi:starch-binding outer membrane protein, SusD/RagB family
MRPLNFRINQIMRINTLLLLVCGLAVGACNGVLDAPPTTKVPAETAIADSSGASAALAGAYSGLQSANLYGEVLGDWLDLLSDNLRHTGTFDDYAQADKHQLRADNGQVQSTWDASYDDINRANQLLAKVPAIADLSDEGKNEVLGEAYFIRALNYHNLVKLWGGVPIRLTPVTSAAEANNITRASVAEVYAQILADLGQAEKLITAGPEQTRQASLGGAYALESRVRLYQQDWAGAEAAASTVESMGYELAPNFSDLFDASGSDTPEDIFRINFTPTDAQSLSFFYLPKALGGRWEVAPTTGTAGIIAAFDPASGGDISKYNPTDQRGIWSISLAGSRTWASKYRNPSGDEDIHVIRLGEVILIRAEALAHLNRLAEAVDEYNRLRERAGLAPDPTTGLTQQGVLAAIARERRLELAFEGDRWPDMVRTGEATRLGVSATQQLLPIPQSELDVASQMTQNPGY